MKKRVIILLFQIMAVTLAIINLVNGDTVTSNIWSAATFIICCIILSTKE